MIELRGRANSAKVFSDTPDAACIAQIINLCNQDFTRGSCIRMMPDVHAGAGCTVGTTMTLTDKAVPNLVGVDIGCGMSAVRLTGQSLDAEKLDAVVHNRVPAGFAVRQKPHALAAQARLQQLHCSKAVDAARALCSIGTLGGGNHFIEADRAGDGAIWLVVHSGSRHLGVEVATHYQKAGYAQCNGSDAAAEQALIQRLHNAGHAARIEKELRALRGTKRTSVPKELAYVSGELFQQYLQDMQIVQEFAALNRRAILEELLAGLGEKAVDSFSTIHNYIDTTHNILRKGAVSAQAGERLLIPMNMRDGSLLCTGLGNPDWNYSAPHGAGRLYSRSEAKSAFTVEEYAQQMQGIYTSCVSRATLDECPMAYKPMQQILENIQETVRVEDTWLPIYNFKAGGDA